MLVQGKRAGMLILGFNVLTIETITTDTEYEYVPENKSRHYCNDGKRRAEKPGTKPEKGSLSGDN